MSCAANGTKDAWRADIAIAARVRANLLLVGMGAVPILLEPLEKDLPNETILSWRPGEPIESPSLRRATTFILHDVHALPATEQQELLRWLEQAAVGIRVISICQEPLWPRVNAGSFDESLDYRLNTVYVDIRAERDTASPGPGEGQGSQDADPSRPD